MQHPRPTARTRDAGKAMQRRVDRKSSGSSASAGTIPLNCIELITLQLPNLHWCRLKVSSVQLHSVQFIRTTCFFTPAAIAIFAERLQASLARGPRRINSCAVMVKLLILGGAAARTEATALPTRASKPPDQCSNLLGAVAALNRRHPYCCADSWAQSQDCVRTWPELLGDRFSWRTCNVAVPHSGSDALSSQCRSIERRVENGMELEPESWAIIHTGGNDLYYSTPAEIGMLVATGFAHKAGCGACINLRPALLRRLCHHVQEAVIRLYGLGIRHIVLARRT